MPDSARLAGGAMTTTGLVRLRLGLALLAAAVIPVAMFLVFDSVTSMERPGQDELLDLAARDATRLAATLEDAADAARGLAADPDLGTSLTSGTPTAGLAARSGAILSRLDGAVSALYLVAPGVAPIAVHGLAPVSVPAAATLLPSRQLAVVESDAGLAVAAAGEHGIVIAELASSALPASGTVVDGSSGRVLSAAGPTSPLVDRSGRLIPAVGVDLAGAGRALVLSQAGDLTVAGAALPTILAGASDLRVIVARELPPAPLPVVPIAALGGLAVLVLVLLWWAARQIVGLARQLEQSRGRLALMYETARADSLSDPLTGLGNHRAFQEEFDRQLEQARRHEFPLALVLLDLDDLKLVNDTRGHAAGDRHLAGLAGLLNTTVRLGDRSFRIGGDEFALILPHTDSEGAAVVTRRLLATALGRRTADQPELSFSAGISVFPDLTTSRAELYAQADAALYWGKRHGRTTVEVFDPSKPMTPVIPVDPERSAAVARLVAEPELLVLFQPIVDVESGRVMGHEGLVRPAPGGLFANAGAMFEAAEAAGRMIELDQACIDAVSAAARDLPRDQLLSLNISPRTVEAPEFSAAWIAAILDAHRVDPRRVVLELTERQAVEDVGRLRQGLAAVRRIGIRVAADDVGAGNAGLRLLSQLDFDVVKVDLSLIHGSATHGAALAVLRSLVELAARWQALVVAEGVEQPDQLRLIRELSITAAQGFLIARPVPSPTLERVDLSALLDEGRLPWLPPIPSAQRSVVG